MSVSLLQVKFKNTISCVIMSISSKFEPKLLNHPYDHHIQMQHQTVILAANMTTIHPNYLPLMSQLIQMLTYRLVYGRAFQKLRKFQFDNFDEDM